MDRLYLGIDVGSTTIKIVLLDSAHAVLSHQYLRASGQPRPVLLEGIATLERAHDLSRLAGVGLSGSGGEAIAQLIGGRHVNELVAQTRAVQEYHPEARTAIEIGGQDSKFLSLELDARTGRLLLRDFAMNTLCAAGTGAFLDQQAERLGIAIDKEFAAIALRSERPARIAGRCTVFAKSDMIHLQQQGTPLPDILAGLCLALARNFHGVIGKGKKFTPPILIQGGIAFNQAVVRAFESLLELKPGELIVPRYHWLMAAIGTAIVAQEGGTAGAAAPFLGFEPLRDFVRSGGGGDGRTLPVLPPIGRRASPPVRKLDGETTPLPVYLGVDVGSISTNVVLIDDAQRVVARRYLMTAGRPLEAVRRGLREVGEEVGSRVRVVSAGTTGSGRHLTGDFIGADVVRNEIAAQARAAIAVDPDVDTIFEIGGQDSKFIRLHNGAIVDFAMNNACAAGTGSFLEEQAEKLKIDLATEFSPLAFGAAAPACLGERCTVFMESDLVHHQQRGARVPDLAAGLAYSITQNFLNRVVAGRAIGKNIFFQGGVASNDSVVSAFRQHMNRKITVPPHHDVTGAIGVAILARETMSRRGSPASAFRGFDLGERQYESSVFECKECPNLCEVNRIVISGEPPIFYGARCDKFEDAGRKKDAPSRGIPDLFAERASLLMRGWTEPGPRQSGRTRIGLPRALLFHELFPFWRAFFDVLGMDVVLSDPTTPRTIRASQEKSVAETCFPVKLLYGHVLELLTKDVDFIFLPSVMTWHEAAPGQEYMQVCPLIAAANYMVVANLDIPADGPVPLPFALQFTPERQRRADFTRLAAKLGVPRRRVMTAAAAGARAMQEFESALRRRGAEVLDGLRPGQRAAVIVGRPYNSADLGACLDLPYKLRRMGVLPIPVDYLAGGTVDITDRNPGMYWRSGQNILGVAKLVADDPRLEAVYLTNFNCGPDSFLVTYFKRTMGAKPFLEVEIDDHTADAGMITRCEAFFDSLTMKAEIAEPALTGSAP
jgi:predicted CoA-substrate-specific enzyme activase